MTTHRLDAAALVINHLLLFGSAGSGEDPTEVEVALPAFRQVVPVQAVFRFDPPAPGEGWRFGDDDAGFVAICALDSELARRVAAEPIIAASLGLRLRVIGSGTLPLSPLLGREIEPYADSLRVTAAEAAGVHPLLFSIIASILDGEHRSPSVSSHLDRHLIVPDSTFMISGWAEGIAEQSVVFVLNDFMLALNPERILSRLGESTGSGGARLTRFTCVDSFAGERGDLRLAVTSGSTVRWSPEMELTKQGSPRVLLRAIAENISYPEALRLAATTDILQKLAASRARPQAAEVLSDYRDLGSAPDLSIIVPFYGDDFFLLDHLESQRRTNLHAEWIFVCDDPGILPPLMEQWRGRGTGGKTSRLLSLSENAGFAAANNIAFRRTRGEFVALMNSDVYWRSLAPLEHGMNLLREDESIGVVGFTLRYEDETIQHSGMKLLLAPDHDDFLHWFHPGKGLPGPPSSGFKARDVDAVTGALMLVRRQDFDGAILDEGYIGGDYEDGDLCLEVRARGKRVLLVECDGIYHLERQSIRAEPTLALMSAINCVRFSQKWDANGRPRPNCPASNLRIVSKKAAKPARKDGARAVSRVLVPEALTSRSAIHAHIFYRDLVDEMMAHLSAEHLAGIDTYITVVDDAALQRVACAVEGTGRKNIHVDRVPNGGRDLAPLFVHHPELFSRYDYLCHLHSKKSTHTDFGDEWRRYLLDACIGSAATVTAILSRFEANPGLAVAYPATFPKIAPFTQVEYNGAHIDAFLKRLNTGWKYEAVDYPAGSMCWMRTAAFLPVIDRMPDSADIEAEEGQVDMTWAHAMERCLTLIPKLEGFASWSYGVEGSAA